MTEKTLYQDIYQTLSKLELIWPVLESAMELQNDNVKIVEPDNFTVSPYQSLDFYVYGYFLDTVNDHVVLTVSDILQSLMKFLNQNFPNGEEDFPIENYCQILDHIARQLIIVGAIKISNKL